MYGKTAWIAGLRVVHGFQKPVGDFEEEGRVGQDDEFRVGFS
jgi:hypothetical protein